MRLVRCRVCGERVRRGRLSAHMRAVHRGKPGLRLVPLALAIIAIVAVTATAIWLIRQPGPTEEDGGGPFDPDVVAVQFNTDDGWVIKGTYYRGNQSMPVVILVPGVGEGREAFGPLVTDLRGAGYNVLAYDPRGCGESTRRNGVLRVWQDMSDAEFQAGTNDVTTARHYALATFPSAPRVAVVGAQLGANQALAAAAAGAAPELKVLVLLSTGGEYRGIESRPAIEALNNRTERPAIFFAASKAEPSAGPVATSLNQNYAGVKSLELLEGGAHGSTLLAYPSFRTQIVQYLDGAFGV